MSTYKKRQSRFHHFLTTENSAFNMRRCELQKHLYKTIIQTTSIKYMSNLEFKQGPLNHVVPKDYFPIQDIFIIS